MNRLDDERRQKISLTQAALQRMGQADPKSFIKEFSLATHVGDIAYVQRHFRDDDVRAGLGVTADNEQKIYTRLHRLIKALGKSSSPKKRLIFW